MWLGCEYEERWEDIPCWDLCVFRSSGGLIAAKSPLLKSTYPSPPLSTRTESLGGDFNDEQEIEDEMLDEKFFSVEWVTQPEKKQRSRMMTSSRESQPGIVTKNLTASR